MKDPVGTDSVAVRRRVLTYSLKPILSYHRLQPEAHREEPLKFLYALLEPPHASVSEGRNRRSTRDKAVIVFLVQAKVGRPGINKNVYIKFQERLRNALIWSVFNDRLLYILL